MTRYAFGLDLGQQADYSALSLVREVPAAAWGEPATYQVPHLHRWELGTGYPAVVDSTLRQVGALVAGLPPGDTAALIVDATGVGRPVLDLLAGGWGALGAELIACTITGGAQATVLPQDGPCPEWHVPKRQLVSAMQVLLSGRRLAIAPALPLAQVVTEELKHFDVKITLSAHEQFGAWREGAHDDLVLAVALPVWALLAGQLGEPFYAAVGGRRREWGDIR
jgi:hypothetical protein